MKSPVLKSSDKLTSYRRRQGAIYFWIAFAAIATLVAAQPLHADDTQPASRAVHLSYIEGQVRVTQGDQVISEGATVNMPLFEEMQVSTAQDGRAEIQFEDGSVARLSPNTTLTLSVLRGEGTQGDAEMLVNGGLAYFEFQGGGEPGRYTVRFADSAVTPSGNTVFRVRMDAPPGEFAVLSGNANLNRGDGGLQLALHGGESVTLYANDINRYDLNESVDPDSWDAWNADRDQATATEESASTAAPPSQSGAESGSPAWSDLDANGSWYDVPGQGYMWSPFDASNAGWDPYGCGSWVYYPRYGYVWVGCNNWGFLPYSCGSWGFYDSFGWGWSPGEGGCNTWWNAGGYGYYPGPRFGTLPPGYRPPHRPINPRGPTPGRPFPVIPVHRTPGPGGTPFPPRDRNLPVTIAGKTVAPIRPVMAGGGEPRTPTGGSARPGFSVIDGSSRGNSSAGRPAYTSPNPGVSSTGYQGDPSQYPPGAYSPGVSRGLSPPAHSSSAGGTSHGSSSNGGSYHTSSAGGGGGASHASSGGGGGGGGGSHASSGGGGGGGTSHK